MYTNRIWIVFIERVKYLNTNKCMQYHTKKSFYHILYWNEQSNSLTVAQNTSNYNPINDETLPSYGSNTKAQNNSNKNKYPYVHKYLDFILYAISYSTKNVSKFTEE